MAGVEQHGERVHVTDRKQTRHPGGPPPCSLLPTPRAAAWLLTGGGGAWLQALRKTLTFIPTHPIPLTNLVITENRICEWGRRRKHNRMLRTALHSEVLMHAVLCWLVCMLELCAAPARFTPPRPTPFPRQQPHTQPPGPEPLTSRTAPPLPRAMNQQGRRGRRRGRAKEEADGRGV